MSAEIYAFPSAPTPEDLARYPMNDLGNAQRLIRLVGGRFDDDGQVDARHCRLLYLRDRGWIAFTGTHWDLKGGEELARRFAHQVARGLIVQGAHISDAISASAWAKFAITSGDAGKATAMLAQAASYLGAGLEDFDPDPLALNVRNGVLRFRPSGAGGSSWSVDFAPRHDPADRMTRLAPVDYDPAATAPRFHEFLEYCQPRADIRDYLAKVFGYCCTASSDEQVFVILQGKGGDGKSTLVNAVRGLLGSYAVTAEVEMFLDTGLRKSADASPDVARLAGDTRLVCTAEPPNGSKLASSAIKTFSGGGAKSARELRQGIFEFEPTCKIVLECNRRPVINDTDDGIWRRLRIVLFSRQIPESQVDRKLKVKLRDEYPGILNWLVGGTLAWLNEGLATPEAVRAAGDDYRRGANPFNEWFADHVQLEPDTRTEATFFHASYKDWCDQNGVEKPMGQTAFGRALGDMQIIRAGKDAKGRVLRKGARLRTEAELAAARGLEAQAPDAATSGVIAADDDEDPFQ